MVWSLHRIWFMINGIHLRVISHVPCQSPEQSPSTIWNFNTRSWGTPLSIPQDLNSIYSFVERFFAEVKSWIRAAPISRDIHEFLDPAIDLDYNVLPKITNSREGVFNKWKLE